MSDSEDDDWFTKDLDEFVAPIVVDDRKDETCHSVTLLINPYKDLLHGSEFEDLQELSWTSQGITNDAIV